MAKNNIKDLIKEWVAIQTQRAERMKLNNIRVRSGNQNYYAKVQINNEVILITPTNDEIPISTFDENRLHGCSENGNTGIALRQRFDRPNVYINFRTINQRNRALSRIRILMREESTSAEDTSGSS